MEIEEINQYLQKNLSTKRYEHSLGVMKKAQELAKIYKVDEQKAKLAGLAHDIAKEMTKEQYINYAKENNIKLTKEDMEISNVLHAFIGADICKNKYNFTKDMKNAIKYHSTGKEQMTMLEKIIYIADKIEENRTYEGVEDLRNLANQNIDEALEYFLNYTIKKCIDQRKKIHELSVKARNYIISENNKKGAV